MMVTDKNLSAFSFLTWKNISAEMIQLQVKARALCGAALCFKVGLTKIWTVAGNWPSQVIGNWFKSESRRLYELDARLYGL